MSEIEKAEVGGEIAAILGTSVAKYADDSAFDGLASGGKWLPRLQLFGGNSDAAKEGKIQMGSYGIVAGKDQLTAVGNEVDCLVLGWRPKAMSLGGEDIITSYNPQSDSFKGIAAKSEEQDSGCMFGPEFLLWLPTQKKYVTFFMSSKSSRREAPNLKGILEGQRDGHTPAATLKVTLIAGKKYKWHNPVVTRCSTPFDFPTDLEELKSVVENFNNPSETEVEVVDEKQTGSSRAR